MRTGILKLADNRYSYSDAEQLVTIPGDADSVTLRIWLYPISGEVSQNLGFRRSPIGYIPIWEGTTGK